jgi:hypothetical protein
MPLSRLVGVLAGATLVALLVNCARDDGREWNIASVAQGQSGPFQGERTAAGIDLNSVKCGWAYYLLLRLYLDMCVPKGDAEVKEDLDWGLAKMAEFIVINSSTPDDARTDLEREISANQTVAKASRHLKSNGCVPRGPRVVRPRC